MTEGQGRARRVPALIIASFFFVFMGPAVVQIYLRNLMRPEEGRMSATTVLAALYFSFMLWRLLTVKSQHVFGDKWSLVFGLAAYLLIPVALAFTTNYVVLLVMAVLWGWGAAGIWLTGPVWLYDNTDPRRRGLWAGVLYMTLFGGLWLGTLLVGFAAKTENRALMLAILIAPGALAVALAAALPSRRARAEGITFAAVRRVFFDLKVIILGSLLFVAATTYGFLLGAFRDGIDDAYGTAAVGTVLSFFFAARLVVSILGGHFSDVFARKSVIALVFFVGGAGLATASASQSVWAFSLGAIALAVVGGTVPVSATAYSADWFAPERRALAMGAAFFWQDAGTALALLAGQYVARTSSSVAAPFLVFAALFLASAFLALFIPEMQRAPEEVI